MGKRTANLRKTKDLTLSKLIRREGKVVNFNNFIGDMELELEQKKSLKRKIFGLAKLQ